MTVTDADLIRALWSVAAALIATGGGVAWWGLRAILSRIDRLSSLFAREMRAFDRRLTRVEALLKLPTPEPPNGEYEGPERRGIAD